MSATIEVTDFSVTLDKAPVPHIEVLDFSVSVSGELSDQDHLPDEAA